MDLPWVQLNSIQEALIASHSMTWTCLLFFNLFWPRSLLAKLFGSGHGHKAFQLAFSRHEPFGLPFVWQRGKTEWLILLHFYSILDRKNKPMQDVGDYMASLHCYSNNTELAWPRGQVDKMNCERLLGENWCDKLKTGWNGSRCGCCGSPEACVQQWTATGFWWWCWYRISRSGNSTFSFVPEPNHIKK